MKAFLYCLYSAFILFSASGFPYPIDSIHWNHRSIVLFAPEKDEHVQAFIVETLMNDCLLQERDIKTVIITRDGFNQPANLFSPEDILLLRKKYNINSDGHTTILIGKDGQEKYRWGEETNWLYITELVDKMPLRKVEMASRPSRCSA
ncbi:DUF4174 domain-containing protein [uncultured Photobacterium sp.]|uniref:DUF4174 domain-containing protein n=1 Tax=uncultured Photobacterium sp. TaxID=173973 RepID=UPI0026072B2C|nr:DUF4174 domain-containing protein [uncultured Photobacterium sp.]